MLYVFLLSGYLLINRYNAGRETFPTFEGTWHYGLIDSRIPFVPWFIWLYNFLYLSLLAPVLVVRKAEDFRKMVFCYLVLFFICFSIFLIYPVKMIRPFETDIGELMTTSTVFEMIADKSLLATYNIKLTGSTFFLLMLYVYDRPFNVFPSLHIANAFLAGIISYRFNRWYGVFWIAFAIVIYITTLLVKQHYFMDGVPSIIMAFGMYYLAFNTRLIFKDREEGKN